MFLNVPGRIFSVLMAGALIGLSLSVSASADEAVLDCAMKRNGAPAFTMTRKPGTPSVYTMTTVGETAARGVWTEDLAVIGRARMKYTTGGLAGDTPVPFLLDSPHYRGSRFYLAPLANTDGSYDAEFGARYSSYSLQCRAAAGFTELQKEAGQAPLVDEATFRKLLDRFLALDCRAAGGTETQYIVRAMDSEYAEVDVSLNKFDLSSFGGNGPRFTAFAFGRNDQYVYKVRMTYEDGDGPRLYVQPEFTLGLNGERLHAVTYVPELKDPSRPIEDLVCQEGVAYPQLEQKVREFRALPVSLPANPGTVAEIDLALCAAKGTPPYREAEARKKKWLAFLRLSSVSPTRKVKDGFGYSFYFDQTTQCQGLDLWIRDAAERAAVRAVVGDSIEGVGIRYSDR